MIEDERRSAAERGLGCVHLSFTTGTVRSRAFYRKTAFVRVLASERTAIESDSQTDGPQRHKQRRSTRREPLAWRGEE